MNNRELSKKLNKLSTAELKLVCKEMGCNIGSKKIMINNLLTQVQKVKPKNVGLNYWGSKRKIAHHIVPYLVKAFTERRNTFAEPFCGTAYISTYLMQYNQCKNRRYILTDTNNHIISLLNAVSQGWIPSYQKVSQKQWNNWKKNKHIATPTKTFYGIIHGFGGMFLNGSKPRLNPGGTSDSKKYVMRKIKALHTSHSCLSKHTNIEITTNSFENLNYKNCVIYCDPPYVCGKSKNARCWSKYKYEQFLARVSEWLRPHLNNRVFLSGSVCPDDYEGIQLKLIWSTKMYTPQSSKNNTNARLEQLWEIVRS